MSAGDPDRRVHAESDFYEVVRYDRAGTWWLERKPSGADRTRVTVRQAAEFTVTLLRDGGKVNLGLPGGRVFERKVRGMLHR